MNCVKLIKTAQMDSACKSAAFAYANYPLFDYLLNKNHSPEHIKQILISSLQASKKIL